MKEIWKDVAGYEGRYKVSNLGNVLSLKYRGGFKEHLLSPVVHHSGYRFIHLGQDKIKFVHVMVAEAFLENPEGKPFVNHMDGDKGNNRLDNLEWVTALENTRHAIKTGLRNPQNIPRRYGKDHYASKAVLQYDLNGNFVREWGGQSEAARFFGCRSGEISICVDKPERSARGFVWRSHKSGEPIQRKIEPFRNRLHH